MKTQTINRPQIDLAETIKHLEQFTPKLKVPEEEETEPRFSYMDLDEETNIPDLQRWVNERQLNGLVDETKGGIIGYIHQEHSDKISGMLNDNQKLLSALQTIMNCFVHKDGDAKGNKVRTDIFKHCPEFRQACVDARGAIDKATN